MIDTDWCDPEDAVTPLHFLCYGIFAGVWTIHYEDSAETALTIINAGWDVNAQTLLTGETACHLALRCLVHDAIEQGNRWHRYEAFGLLRVLIDAGADFSIKDRNGFSPARIAFNYMWRCHEMGFPEDMADEISRKYPGEYADWLLSESLEGEVWRKA
jgi:hypothetical protein